MPKKDGVVRQKKFGEDLGVIHEMIVTGRKVGADEQFYGRLAHSKETFQHLVEIVRELPGYSVGLEWIVPLVVAARCYQMNHIAKVLIDDPELLKSVCKMVNDAYWEKRKQFQMKALEEAVQKGVRVEQNRIYRFWDPGIRIEEMSEFPLLVEKNVLHRSRQYGWCKTEEDAPQERCIRLPIPNSFGLYKAEQLQLLQKNEACPSGRVIYMLAVVHFLATGERLLERHAMRCDDDLVIGPFGEGELSVGQLDPDKKTYRNCGLGMAAMEVPF